MNPRLKEFQMRWNRFAPNGDRNARLLWLGELLGKPVDSANQLSTEELDLACRELRSLSAQGSNRVVSMRGAPVKMASPEQLFKLKQLEIRIGWKAVPERLAGFLRSKYRVDRAEQLSARDAWRAIEALFGIAAAPHKGKEKTAEIKRLKELLTTWRPDQAA